MKRWFLSISLLFFYGLILSSGCANKAPAANDADISTQEDMPVEITLAGSDPEGDLLTWHIETRPANGSLSGTEPNLVYTPRNNFNGIDSFSFVVSDGRNQSNSAKVSVLVKPVNDPPVAKDDAVTAAEDTPIVTIDVLANDTDVDQDKLVVFRVGQGSGGQVTINTDNKLTYKPAKNFNGDDSFTYTVSDGRGGTATAAVNIKITPVNDAPKIVSKPVTASRVWGVYRYDVNAIDPDKQDKLTYSLTNAPEGMTIDPAGGLIEFRPTSAQAGNYDITVKVEDSAGEPACDMQSFTLSVASLSSPLKEILNVEDLYNSRATQKLSSAGLKDALSNVDEKVIEVPAGGSISFDFSDIVIPQGGKIASLVIFVEHFEDENFPAGQLRWSVGTGWPNSPTIYSSLDAPVRSGRQNKTDESWDITSLCSTVEKINSFQLLMQNKGSTAKSFIDKIYAVVLWY